MTTQLNVRLPDITISEINDLAEVYGSQAKAIIAAVTNLHKEITMRQQALAALDKITAAKSEEARTAAADRAIAEMRKLPDSEQQAIAQEEFKRFKRFLENRNL